MQQEVRSAELANYASPRCAVRVNAPSLEATETLTQFPTSANSPGCYRTYESAEWLIPALSGIFTWKGASKVDRQRTPWHVFVFV